MTVWTRSSRRPVYTRLAAGIREGSTHELRARIGGVELATRRRIQFPIRFHAVTRILPAGGIREPLPMSGFDIPALRGWHRGARAREPKSARRSLLWTLAVAALFAATWGGGAREAHAYPQWQLSGDTVRCAQCHFSPGGGGLINNYGRD